MAKKIQKKRFQKPLATGPCFFCESKKTPSYKEYKDLKKFISERARVIPRKYSALCSRHQRIVSLNIKRAQHLGLLALSPLS